MFEWLAEQFGEQTALIIYYFVIFVALIIAVFILRWLWKTMSGGTFVHGAKSERRLAVVDATAVDSRRRLVLVRRDNVEHLVMIGGMSDVLIESNIGEPKTSPAPQREERAAKVRPQESSKAAPIAAAPLIAAAAPAASNSPREKASEPAVETLVASVPDVSHEAAPTIEPQVQRSTPTTPPAPLVKEPQNLEPTIEIATNEVFSEHDFDLDISASDLTAGIEKPSRTVNTFEPTVDFPSDKIERANNDEAREPMEDEMEALLNKLTSSDK
ncbi:flagellar biosynthetic protein FliO [Ahrensia sp. 13_GOM-1096m]|uniref:flagellar biosynthetic protein FliO n=1 Tax=Ahrensia sp. 13_GOM-1096m TaxID=1380380 RepID=UPI0006841712|nr:flagellar biosynthetic protein FliO [Ahrensia sp. 13_GOM-1096m]